jgi:hypothetical protein
MSRCRESSGVSFGSQIVPPAESSWGNDCDEHGEPAEVLHRRVPADVALADERRPVDRAEDHVVAADVHAVRRVAGLHVELARGLGHLLEHELRVELDDLAVGLLPGLAEQLDRLGLGELDADLGHDAPPAPVQDADGIFREDLVPGHAVDGTSPPQFHADWRLLGSARACSSNGARLTA